MTYEDEPAYNLRMFVEIDPNFAITKTSFKIKAS
jgi:hypothetical protein